MSENETIKRVSTDEVIRDRRFRQTIMAGEYTRALTVFLHLQYPEIDDVSRIPRSISKQAQETVDKAFFDYIAVSRSLDHEMR